MSWFLRNRLFSEEFKRRKRCSLQQQFGVVNYAQARLKIKRQRYRFHTNIFTKLVQEVDITSMGSDHHTITSDFVIL